jgi:hypothetical protein
VTSPTPDAARSPEANERGPEKRRLRGVGTSLPSEGSDKLPKASNFSWLDKTIKHLFFYCRSTRPVCSVIYVSSGLSQHCSMSLMCGTWLRGFRMELKSLFLLGATTTCWSLWSCKNSIIYTINLILPLYRLSSRLYISFVHGPFYKC